MTRTTPYKHGLAPAPTVDERGVLDKPRLRVGGAESLLAMSEEYAFFTPAILYLSGFFSDAALVDFVHETGGGPVFYHYLFDSQIFKGLVARDGDAAWNRVLWALARSFWPAFQDFLCSVVIANRARRLVVGIGQQELTILDPLALDRKRLATAQVPLLPISAFGVNGNKFRYALAVGDPLTSLPTAGRYAPAGDMTAFAEALFAGHNPNDARLDYHAGAAGEGAVDER